MQKYLQPNNIRISREETQLIFKLRCRVTNVKTNMRNMYSEVICDACGIQEESQKHIIQECLKLNENNDSIKYEKIYNGSVSEKVEIAIKFEENFKKLQEYRITWRKKIFTEEVFYPMFWDQVTWKYSCLLYYLYRVGNTLLLLLPYPTLPKSLGLCFTTRGLGMPGWGFDLLWFNAQHKFVALMQCRRLMVCSSGTATETQGRGIPITGRFDN